MVREKGVANRLCSKLGSVSIRFPQAGSSQTGFPRSQDAFAASSSDSHVPNIKGFTFIELTTRKKGAFKLSGPECSRVIDSVYGHIYSIGCNAYNTVPVKLKSTSCTAHKSTVTKSFATLGTVPLTLDPATLDPATLDPATLDPATLDPATLDPVTLDPATLDPATLDPATLDPATLDPATLDPATLDPVTLDPATLDPATLDPATLDPATLDPVTLDPATLDPATLDPATLDPATLDPVTLDPATLDPATLDPATDVRSLFEMIQTQNNQSLHQVFLVETGLPGVSLLIAQISKYIAFQRMSSVPAESIAVMRNASCCSSLCLNMVIDETGLNRLRVEIQLREIQKCMQPASSANIARINYVMNYFGYSNQIQETAVSNRKENIQQFYNDLKLWRERNYADITVGPHLVQHPSLVPLLRPYQMKAINWMLNREINEHTNSEKGDILGSSFECIRLACGTVLYWSRLCGIFSYSKPTVTPLPLGGILADEMGLGKTVEVISLILNNPKEKSLQRHGRIKTAINLNCVDGFDIIRETVDKLVSQVSALVEGENLVQKKKFKPVHLAKKLKRKGEQDVFYLKPTKKPRNSKNSKDKIECFCGANSFQASNENIKCMQCNLMQHRSCVNWDFPHLDHEYLCPQCRKKCDPIMSKTTLIIAPSSICRQWFEEIKRHVRDTTLSVLVYGGVSGEGYVQPRVLVSYDIIICTYETMRCELRYADLKSNDRLRFVKRFSAPPSPLTSVNWWRICLDEAQMVEGITTATAAMCHRLPAVHRWCITGTPIQKSVWDLYGLISFLDVEPYTAKEFWNVLLWEPYILHANSTNVLTVIGQLLWRTEKIDVVDQLRIPSQNHKISWFSFGPVEEHFYRRTREKLFREIDHVISKFSDQTRMLKDLDRRSVDMLMKPLKQLRKVCCHPQINTHGRLVPINQKVMTMNEVLEKMQKDTKRECKEEHRALVASYNGLAGIYCLKNEFAFAAEQYRQVIRSCHEHDGKVETDSLQRIHALHNLDVIIKNNRDSIPPTLRDDNLSETCTQLQEKYLKQLRLVIADRCEEMKEATHSALQTKDQFLPGAMLVWFTEILQKCREQELGVEMVERIKINLSHRAGISDAAAVNVQRFIDSFRDVHGLGMVLTRELRLVEECRIGVVDCINQLNEIPPNDARLNEQPRDCHLRPIEGRPTSTCSLCLADDVMTEYEKHLFSIKENIDTEGAGRVERHLRRGIEEGELGEAEKEVFLQQKRGNWADSPAILALKSLLSYGKTNNLCESDVGDAGLLHFKVLNLYRKEFKAIRSLWLAVCTHVAERDELEMAKERLRFLTREEEEALKDPATAHLVPKNAIPKYTIEENRLQLIGDQTTARNNLQRKLRHLSYLTTLDSMKDSTKGNVEECPVCQLELGIAWAVFQCGHCFCQECCKAMCKRSAVGANVRCALCRMLSNREAISYVVSRKYNSEKKDVMVRGSYSTKIEEIVRCLLTIKSNEPQAKCLVFSSWQEVLEVLGRALDENIINFMRLKSQNHHTCVHNFKNSVDCQVLLLPLSSGANGLNLVEATHVLLVEPQMNPAAEQQAIGRVHRIGQIKPTTVHRFLMQRSVEEQLHELLGEHNPDERLITEDQSPITIQQLAHLFSDPVGNLQNEETLNLPGSSST